MKELLLEDSHSLRRFVEPALYGALRRYHGFRRQIVLILLLLII